MFAANDPAQPSRMQSCVGGVVGGAHTGVVHTGVVLDLFGAGGGGSRPGGLGPRHTWPPL